MENINNNDVALDWNSAITDSEPSFIVLPAGTYFFEVTKFERGQFAGSEKMKACPKADVTLKCNGKEGTAYVSKTLFLNSKYMWLLSQFFVAIGQKKKGQDFQPNWNAIIGSTGIVRLGVKTYISNRDGQQHTTNEVLGFIEQTNTAPVSTQQKQQIYQQQAFNPQQFQTQQLRQPQTQPQIPQTQTNFQQVQVQQPMNQVPQSLGPQLAQVAQIEQGDGLPF